MDPRLDDAVRRARSGDPRAFRTVTDILGPGLVRFLTIYLAGDSHAAHDVAQDTLVRAWDSIARIQDGTHLRRWCYRVAQCKAVSWIRRRHPRGRRFESLDVVRDDTPVRPANRHTKALVPVEDGLAGTVRSALDRLPPNYAGPVTLYYLQGFTTRETAELLGVTRGTVKMRLYRARAFLRREIHRAASVRPLPEQ
ncbi:MAG: RNA polymerase sigma factor, partial [Planctomycetota bacterium]